MMWLEVLFLLFVLVLAYALFAPFYLEVDSEINLLRIRFHHLASAKLLTRNSSLIIQLNVAGWNKEMDLFTEGVKQRKTTSVVKRKRKSSKIQLRKVIAVLKSFKVNTCYINFDCGNMQWNGILFPLFFWISKITGKDIRINFIGVSNIKLEIENNFARIIWAFVYK